MDNNYNYANTDETVNNNQYNYPPAYNMPQQPIEQDKVNVGFCILGWFIPLFALIYFCTKKQEKPKGAKAVGIVGLVSFILNLIVMITSSAFTGLIVNKTLDTVDNFADSSIVENYQGDEWLDNLGDVKDAVDNSTTNNENNTDENDDIYESNDWKYDDEINNYDDAKNYIDGFADRMGVD